MAQKLLGKLLLQKLPSSGAPASQLLLAMSVNAYGPAAEL